MCKFWTGSSSFDLLSCNVLHDDMQLCYRPIWSCNPSQPQISLPWAIWRCCFRWLNILHVLPPYVQVFLHSGVDYPCLRRVHVPRPRLNAYSVAIETLSLPDADDPQRVATIVKGSAHTALVALDSRQSFCYPSHQVTCSAFCRLGLQEGHYRYCGGATTISKRH